MENKKCSVCGKNLPTTTEYFYKHRNALHAKCIDCYKKYQSEKHSSPEYKEKRAKRLASQREHINKRQRAYWLAHKEHLLEYHRQWAKNNPDVGLASIHRRRARKLDNKTEKYTKTDVLEKYKNICHICGKKINLKISGKPGAPNWRKGLQLDHVIPLMKGGPDTLENVRPSHGGCNLDKGAS
jgi:hypothetical protein